MQRPPQRPTHPDRHGHRARSPWRIPPAGWKEIAKRTWNQTWVDNAGLVAAGVAFYGFLAIVPLLGMIVLIYGFFAEPQTVVENMRALMTVLPNDVAVAIGEQLMTVVQTSEQTKGLAILLGLAFAIYGGTNAASAIITALNIAYQEKEKRSLGKFYLLALTMTLGAVAVAVTAIAAMAVIAELEALMPRFPGPLVLAGKVVSYVVLVFAAAGIAATLYRYGPSREEARWEWITPGSMFTAVTWLLLTAAFGFYVTQVTDYNATYGPVGAIVALQTWLYLSSYVFVVGAELNSEVEHQTAHDSTTGPPLPMGNRGAWAADHVADEEETGLDAGPSLAEANPGAVERREEKQEKERERR